MYVMWNINHYTYGTQPMPTMALVNRRKRWRWSFLAMTLVGALSTLAPGAPPTGLSQDLSALELVSNPDGLVDVIVTYSSASGPRQRARLEELGATHRRDLRLIHGIAARVPVNRRKYIAGSAEVVSISLDDEIRAATDIAVPSTTATLARQVYGLDGSGVRVAVLDSGIAPVSGLGGSPDAPTGKVAAWIDLVQPRAHQLDDPYGHGTHVAGIIAGVETEIHDPGDRRTYGGVAPGVELVSVRVLDHRGRGLVSDAIAGLEWVTRHADEWNIRVVNLSLGHPVRDPGRFDPLVRACEEAWRSGLLVVVSAGNLGREEDSYGTVTSPGNSPIVLTVGAMVDHDSAHRSDDTVATYSSRGPTRFDGVVKPDLLAPGDDVISLRSPHSFLDRRFSQNRVGSTSTRAGDAAFFRLSGTSMAAAMVSGIAALMFSQSPELTPDDVKARLMRSAEKRTDNIYTQGAGLVDALAALETGGRVESSASAHTYRDEVGVTVVQTARWSETKGWDLETVYGPGALWDSALVWDFMNIWSADSKTGDEIVWQVPGPGQTQSERVWRRVPSPTSQSVVWQLVDFPMPDRTDSESVVWQGRPDKPLSLDGESVVWQGRPGKGNELTSESVVWQGRPDRATGATDGFLSGESVVWQGRPVDLAGGLADDFLTAESVVWQQTDQALRVLIMGDGTSDH